jgi:sugar (pentulose or hexulose) kinase
VKENKWDPFILDLAGLKEENFSPIKQSGEVTGYLKGEICNKIGIKTKVPVINGGHDQYCAGIGAGIFSEKDILLSTGTAWVVFKMLSKPVFDSKRYFAVGRNILENKFGIIYSIPAAGASIKWFANNVMNKENENELFKLISRNKNAFRRMKNNIIFYPYLTGEYGPKFNTKRKAEFINLELGHNYLDLAKAIMEGIGFQFKKILDVFKEKNIESKNIRMVGGGARSEVWPEIIANITGKNVYVPRNHDEDYATKGAAIIAGFGSGVFKTLKEGYDILSSGFNVVEPEREENKYYKEKIKNFNL